MPKPKKAKKTDLKEFLEGYDYKVLHGAINGLQDGMAWDLLSAFLRAKQRQYEIASLDLVRHGSETHAAAHASGYAQALEDTADHLIPELINVILGRNGVVEDPRPEENN